MSDRDPEATATAPVAQSPAGVAGPVTEAKTSGRRPVGNYGLALLRALAGRAMIVILLAVIVAFAALSDRFATFSNAQTILQGASALSLLAVGQTLVILSGGIDLSVGSLVALSGVVAALIVQGSPDMLVPAVLAGVGVGLLAGLGSGLLVAIARVPPFIVTLGMMTSASGLAYVFSNGSPISGLPDNFLAISSGSIFGLQIPIAIMIVTFAVFLILLTRTAYGMRLYSVGGNPTAARIAGIRVPVIYVSAYAVSGALAGLAGVILASRVTAGIPTTGAGYELDSIAAVVVGGASLLGGRGTLWGTALGLFLIQTLNNGFDILNVTSYVQKIVKGALIVVAVFVDVRANRPRS